MDDGNGWIVPVLGALLLALGLLARLDLPGGRPRLPVGIPWADADPDIRRRSRRRLGELLILWAIWLGAHPLLGIPAAWIYSVWAPLSVLLFVAVSYPARLYLRRYFPELVAATRPGAGRTIPARGGWLVVALRELVPLAIVLAPILVVRGLEGELPERVPIRWALRDGPLMWEDRRPALAMLRHQTMFVYLFLIALEGLYLAWRLVRGTRGDMAPHMLTPRYWLFFLFRLGWVALFSGLNLGFLYHAVDGRSPLPFLLPGLFTLALLGLLAHRQAQGSAPASGPRGAL